MFKFISTTLYDLFVETFRIHPNLAYFPVTVVLLVSIVVLIYFVWRLSRWGLNKLVPKIYSQTKTAWDDIVFSKQVVAAIAMLIPALILDFIAPFIFGDLWQTLPVVKGMTNVIIVFTLAWILASILKSTNEILTSHQSFKDKPIGSITQLGVIFVYVIAFLLSISIVFDKSPVLILSGLGAIAAVVLLVFKDSILGFVASIQLSAYNMVHVGDWVTVSKFNADGNVLEINLTTIKVQNFDNTITAIPTYAFVSDSFKNWRGMIQSQGRRIKRAINIRIQSVQFCNAEMIERFEKIHLVQDYIKERLKEIEEYNSKNKVDGSIMVNGRKLTNIGVFEVYLENYLRSNPYINREMTIMVRQLPPTAIGIPLEIYAFSKEKEWVAYEKIMAAIFDHIIASVAYFDLQIFENPTGIDFQRLK